MCLEDADCFAEGLGCRHMSLNHIGGSEPSQRGSDGELVLGVGCVRSRDSLLPTRGLEKISKAK